MSRAEGPFCMCRRTQTHVFNAYIHKTRNEINDSLPEATGIGSQGKWITMLLFPDDIAIPTRNKPRLSQKILAKIQSTFNMYNTRVHKTKTRILLYNRHYTQSHTILSCERLKVCRKSRTLIVRCQSMEKVQEKY